MNLRQRWKGLLESAGIDTNKAKEGFRILKKYYGEPHRRYHNFKHIETMLTLMDEYHSLIEKPFPFELAIWFHDVIYQPSGVDNEEESTLLAEKMMKEWKLKPEDIKLTTQYIRSTSGHVPRVESFDCSLFLDLDLAILGFPADEYNRYSRGIRKEYDIYDDEYFFPARKKVMNAFLKRERIYFTDIMKDRFEASARQNIRREIDK